LHLTFAILPRMSSDYFSQQIPKLYQDAAQFSRLALEIFQYQANSNAIYQRYLSLLHVEPDKIANVAEIPCLPISFFKKYALKTGDWESKLQFSSSGTGGIQSVHHVRDQNAYLKNTVNGFETFFKSPSEYCFLALLPSYLEREGSSLVLMLEHFIAESDYLQSGFYLNEFDLLKEKLQECIAHKIPTILFGVPFGLLDFGEAHPMDLSDITIFETGGMKGRRAELTKAQLYNLLEEYFNPKAIYSEYGMTEMFSQAYSLSTGKFQSSPTMDIAIREINDPFHLLNYERLGAINIYDLANFETISFIATDDLGRKYSDGSFEVLGRMDNSDLRGCNLLIDEQR